MRLSDDFVRKEWERIILPKSVTTELEYLSASRRGRGISITRNERKALWPVFEEMRNELSLRKLVTAEDAGFLASILIKQEGNLNHRYGAVVVDETQDLGPEALTLLAQLAKRYSVDGKDAEPCIFLVGDGHLRIYSKVASLSACGINVRGGRSSRLKVTYRTTEETRRIANAVLLNEPFDDMDGGSETLAGNRSIRHGQQPELYRAQDFEDEVEWIAQKIKEVQMDNPNYQTSDICIVARTQKLIHSYKEGLEKEGYRVVSVARNKADDTTSGLRVATMHRVKGLEFKVVFIAGANEGTMPLIKENSDDETENKLALLQERSLFYVSASRARDLLFISCSGLPGEFMKLLSKPNL